MKLIELLKAIRTESISGTTDKDITDIQMDSRRVQKGGLFVAVKGTQADGHAFIGKAIDQGATAIVWPRKVSDEHSWLVGRRASVRTSRSVRRS